MLQNLQAVIEQMFQGAIASTILTAFFLIVAVITCNGSRVSKARKLPDDSDIRLLVQLVGIGALIGGLSATMFGGAGGGANLLTCLISFKAGILFALYRVSSLNNAYLKRARCCLDAGDYRGGIEDASEVARSSERLRKIAMEIKLECEKGVRSQFGNLGRQ